MGHLNTAGAAPFYHPTNPWIICGALRGGGGASIQKMHVCYDCERVFFLKKINGYFQGMIFFTKYVPSNVYFCQIISKMFQLRVCFCEKLAHLRVHFRSKNTPVHGVYLLMYSVSLPL